MAAAAICMRMFHHHPPPPTVTAGRLPGRNQEGVYDPNHCGVATPDTWTLLLHLTLNCLESGTWTFTSPGTSHGAVTAPACLEAAPASPELRLLRESAPPERKALPRMLKAAEVIATPPQTYTCRQMQKKRGLRHHDPPCTQAVSLPPLRPEVEKHQTHKQLLSTGSETVDVQWSPLTQTHILVHLPLWGHMWQVQMHVGMTVKLPRIIV